jgi:site-specific DNA-cytosine methylase
MWFGGPLPKSKPGKCRIRVVDLFAGPGGLAEGFASLDEADLEFSTVVSVEKDEAAYRTLTLRAFFRQTRTNGTPPEYYAYLRGEIPRKDLFDETVADAPRPAIPQARRLSCQIRAARKRGRPKSPHGSSRQSSDPGFVVLSLSRAAWVMR